MEAAAEQQKRKFQELELEAEARGVMTASANSHGFVKCPHCAMSFSIRHSMSWDGKMHKSCHTRLRVSNWENA